FTEAVITQVGISCECKSGICRIQVLSGLFVMGDQTHERCKERHDSIWAASPIPLSFPLIDIPALTGVPSFAGFKSPHKINRISVFSGVGLQLIVFIELVSPILAQAQCLTLRGKDSTGGPTLEFL